MLQQSRRTVILKRNGVENPMETNAEGVRRPRRSPMLTSYVQPIDPFWSHVVFYEFDRVQLV